MTKRIFRWLRRAVNLFLSNHCSMHAAGLTYFAMLALVPTLCVFLYVAKACGVHDYAHRQANAYLDTLITSVETGQDQTFAFLAGTNEEEREKKRIAAAEFAGEARKISNALFERIDTFDMKTFGWIGFVLLVWTVISSVSMVEVSFNEIWSVPKPRPFWKRVILCLSVTTVLPLLTAVALSVPIIATVKDVLVATMGATWLTKWVSDGLVWFLDSFFFRNAVTLLLGSLVFAFFFYVKPNCRVKITHALYGGVLTTLLFGGWLKACAVAQVGIARSSALYGSFAFFPIILAWMYMSWQIVLFGACMTCAFTPRKP